KRVVWRWRPMKIAAGVALEVQAVDDDRLGLLVRRVRVGRDIAHHEREPLAVRRPLVVANSRFELGDALRLAAAAIEQPELATLPCLSRRDERHITSVRTT